MLRLPLNRAVTRSVGVRPQLAQAALRKRITATTTQSTRSGRNLVVGHGCETGADHGFYFDEAVAVHLLFWPERIYPPQIDPLEDGAADALASSAMLAVALPADEDLEAGVRMFSEHCDGNVLGAMRVGSGVQK